MFFDELGWCQSEPLVQADILEDISVEYLEEFERGIAGVLDVMTHACRDVSDVTSLIIKCPGIRLRREDGYSGCTLNEETPFVLGRMPVEFPDRTRFHSDLGRSDSFRNLERGGIDDLNGTSR